MRLSSSSSRGNRAGRSSQSDQRRAGKNRRTLSLEVMETRTLLNGTFAPVTTPAPNFSGTMMLQTDGSVLMQGGGVTNTWYKLTPNSSGSYAAGTWSQAASMSTSRLYFGSNVLPDGRVFVVGGEYSSTTSFNNTSEIYNPTTNAWTHSATFPLSQYGDDPTTVLANGKILAGYISGPQTYVYDPTANTWTQGATKLRNDQSDEESWVKLPNGNILSYDIFSSVQTGVSTAQYYNVATNQWLTTGNVPVQLSSSGVGYELGPAFLLPDGRVFQLGANGNTAYYDYHTNTWTAGPAIPSGRAADDAPGTELPNGKIIFTADTPLFNSPTHIYEFDPTAGANGTYTDLTAGSGLGTSFFNTPSYVDRMLMLPSGQVLINNGGSQLEVFTPDLGPLPITVPTITTIARTGTGTYLLTGTGLNGISEGSGYGDDAEMASNYPIVQLTNTATNHVYYAKTTGWISQVATGTTPETTNFSLPAGLPLGVYHATLIANGSPSLNQTLVVDNAPTIATAASASPNPDGGITANLSVLGADALGESTLTYNWTTTAKPAGSANPTFSVNGTNAAKNDVVSFFAAGNYTFLVTLTNSAGLTVTSAANLTVTQTLTTLNFTPAAVTLPQNGTQQFVASAFDQFGTAFTTAPVFIYSVVAGGAGGTISSTGLYTAPATTFGLDTVHVVSGALTGSAVVTVTQAPVITLQPTNQTVTQGQTATFASAATGYPTPTVQWMVSTDGVHFTPVAGATSPTLSFVAQTSQNGNEYEAVYTNSIGSTTTIAATLTVTPLVANVTAVSTSWGVAGVAPLVTAADGLRLLPSGRNTDLPWLGINRLTITLSQGETLLPSDVTVTGITIANYGPVTITALGTGNTSYLITLAQAINAADRVTVTIGNATITTYTRRLDVLPGDVNDDGAVTSADVVAGYGQIGTNYIFADIFGDGIVSLNSLRRIRSLNGTKLPAIG